MTPKPRQQTRRQQEFARYFPGDTARHLRNVSAEARKRHADLHSELRAVEQRLLKLARKVYGPHE